MRISFATTLAVLAAIAFALGTNMWGGGFWAWVIGCALMAAAIVVSSTCRRSRAP